MKVIEWPYELEAVMVRREKILVLRDKVSRTSRGEKNQREEVKITLVSNLTILMDNNAMNHQIE